jgi:GH15 family glucan-1,4-alpha-glucosidase
MPFYPPIKDYAAIGDCGSIALISKEGSLDWLCWPRFDSPSLFGALLDSGKGGRFRICPEGSFETTRRYIDNTNVLETRFRTDTGIVRLVDVMPLLEASSLGTELAPEHEVLRFAECIEGRVEMSITCDPRPGYASVVPVPIDRGNLGFQYDLGTDLYTLRSTVSLSRRGDRAGLEGRAMLGQGQSLICSFSAAHGYPAVLPALGRNAQQRIASTIRWWRGWIGHCPYKGLFREAVLRSILALKLLIFAPSGAIIAAATASLPEEPGGGLNWDYRFCWIRDSAMTLRALLGLGYRDEGEAFFSWLIHATRLTQPELQVVYDVYGESRLAESELDGLEGYGGARPVRIGNAAQQQFQLDVYGEVMRAAGEFVRGGGRLDRSMQRMLKGIGTIVMRQWQEPDHGIWEIRGLRRHHTFSKAMCWIALKELLALAHGGHLRLPERTMKALAETRSRIGAAIERQGYNDRIRSYVSVFDSDIVDASLLILPLYGYCDPSSERMQGTHARIREKLGSNGMLYRYRADFSGRPELKEGAFGICSFWDVSFLARSGRREEAARLLSHLLTFGNDVGLFAEEIEPASGAALGNFPQAFTHVGLIDAALSLQEGEKGSRDRPRPVS